MAAAAAALLSAFFVFGVSPDIVWCHKPDGRVLLEYAPAGRLCSCESCCQYRHEHHMDEGAELHHGEDGCPGHAVHTGRNSASAFSAAGCVHVPFIENSAIRNALGGDSGSAALGASFDMPAEPAPASVFAFLPVAIGLELIQPGRSPSAPAPAVDILRL